jgi:hypothetical protein
MRFQRSLIESEDGNEPTQEMKAFYNKRTRIHITNVNKGAIILAKAFPEIGQQLLARTRQHDRSKYSKEEYLPYVWMTWKRKKGNEKFEYPAPEIEQQVKKAIDQHMTTNRHHPEFHSNISKMTVLDMAEMVCDWHSFHYEFGDDTNKWADKNLGTRWKFNNGATKLIYRYIEELMK